MIREGSRLILIEIKASTLTAQAKYSFTPELLWDELLRKAIDGEDGDRKGIAQLHHAIRRFHDGEAITGITSQEITTIYPVIVFLDRSFTSPYLINLYRERFDRTTLKKRPTTTAPYAITISDLENILPYSHEHGIGDIMDDYYTIERPQAPSRLAASRTPTSPCCREHRGARMLCANVSTNSTRISSAGRFLMH